MAIHGTTVAAFRVEFSNLARPLQIERDRIRTAPDYSATERNRALAPITAQLLTLHADYSTKIAAMLTRAKSAHLKAMTGNQQLRAAYENPARAVAMRQLAEGASSHRRESLAMLIAEGNDLPGAYGLQAALGDGDGNTSAVLATVGGQYADAATADLVLALHENAAFVGAGAFNDPAKNPLGGMQAADAVKLIPDSLGGTITLSDADVARYLEIASR